MSMLQILQLMAAQKGQASQGILGNIATNKANEQMKQGLMKQISPDTPWQLENLPLQSLQKMQMQKFIPKENMKIGEGGSLINSQGKELYKNQRTASPMSPYQQEYLGVQKERNNIARDKVESKVDKTYRTDDNFFYDVKDRLKGVYGDTKIEDKALSTFGRGMAKNYRSHGDFEQSYEETNQQLTGGEGLQRNEPWFSSDSYGLPKVSSKVKQQQAKTDQSLDMNDPQIKAAFEKSYSEEEIREHIQKRGY